MVSDYARELAVTPNYLNEIIRKKTGIAASDHIKNRIILEAKREAVHGGGSMKEIAYRLGFDDLAHFSKYFKNATGRSFTEFRKRNCTIMNAGPISTVWLIDPVHSSIRFEARGICCSLRYRAGSPSSKAAVTKAADFDQSLIQLKIYTNSIQSGYPEETITFRSPISSIPGSTP